jgi:ectoine hydroxylase-related dioxygenase (phytanoyl-CoA dioxygenase family)
MNEYTNAKQRADFERDGVAVIRGGLTPDDVAHLRAVVENCLVHPSPLAHRFSLEGEAAYHSDMYLSAWLDDMRAFTARARLAAMAAELMRSNEITLYNDELLVKEPNATRTTPWHHDLPYWPLGGTQVCSAWCSLDDVTRESGSLEFIAGSHEWGVRFHPRNFDSGESRVTSGDEQTVDVGDESEHRLLCWDLVPGDVLIFHAYTVHRAAGNNSTEERRRAVVFRLTGDDVTWQPRPRTIPIIWAPGLAPGDALHKDGLFPRLWPTGS